MEKKNTGVIVNVVVLALLLGLLGGYIITDKFVNKDKETSQGEQNNNNNNGNENNNSSINKNIVYQMQKN